MREAFELFKSFPTVGDFLAYQYATDVNYSTVTHFSEMDFVVPGPGACWSVLTTLIESHGPQGFYHKVCQLLNEKQLTPDDFSYHELAEACGIPSHMASEHLRLMQRCGLLGSEKEGRKAYYSVAEPHLANILECVEARFG